MMDHMNHELIQTSSKSAGHISEHDERVLSTDSYQDGQHHVIQVWSGKMCLGECDGVTIRAMSANQLLHTGGWLYLVNLTLVADRTHIERLDAYYTDDSADDLDPTWQHNQSRVMYADEAGLVLYESNGSIAYYHYYQLEQVGVIKWCNPFSEGVSDRTLCGYVKETRWTAGIVRDTGGCSSD